MSKTLHRLPLDEWFDDIPHPHDSMPIAKDPNENPRPEEEIADDITLHEKMYRLATEKHSPWSGGGSENWNTPKT